MRATDHTRLTKCSVSDGNAKNDEEQDLNSMAHLDRIDQTRSIRGWSLKDQRISEGLERVGDTGFPVPVRP